MADPESPSGIKAAHLILEKPRTGTHGCLEREQQQRGYVSLVLKIFVDGQRPSKVAGKGSSHSS